MIVALLAGAFGNLLIPRTGRHASSPSASSPRSG
jgi:hypothetical protein